MTKTKCPTPQKQIFANEDQAQSTADKMNAEYPNGRENTPYECACGKWHLTTHELEGHRSSPITNNVAIHRNKGADGETTEKVRILLAEGKSKQQIAEALQISYNTVNYHTRKLLGPSLPATARSRSTAGAPTMESLAQAELDLKNQLKEIEEKRLLLIEAKKCHTFMIEDAGITCLLIRKEGLTFKIPLEIWKESLPQCHDLIRRWDKGVLNLIKSQDIQK